MERERMTRIAVDIDGTLGYRNRQRYLQLCNETLHLAMTEERLHQMSLHTFLHSPELLSYKARVGEAYATRALGWIDFHPEVLRAMHPFQGANEGVALLAAVGTVAYYTARYTSQSEERSQGMAQATIDWLTTHAFLNPTQTVFCDGLPGKLKQIGREMAHHAEPVLLIDDQYTRLIQTFHTLDEDLAHQLQDSLILVGYGTCSVPEHESVPLVALPSWEKDAVHHMLDTVMRLQGGKGKTLFPNIG